MIKADITKKLKNLQTEREHKWVRQSKFTDFEYRGRNDWRFLTDADVCQLTTGVNHLDKIITSQGRNI